MRASVGPLSLFFIDFLFAKLGNIAIEAIWKICFKNLSYVCPFFFVNSTRNVNTSNQQQSLPPCIQS